MKEKEIRKYSKIREAVFNGFYNESSKVLEKNLHIGTQNRRDFLSRFFTR